MKLSNILIINTFGIGDVLFSTPLIREIGRNLPDSSIHFICNRRNLDMLKNDPHLKEIIVYEKDDFRDTLKVSKIAFLKKMVNFIKEIRRLKIDAAIDLTLNHQMSIILILAGVKLRLGFNYKKRGRFLTHRIELAGFNDKHVALYYLDLLKFLGIKTSGEHSLRTYTSTEKKKEVDDFLKKKGLLGKTLIGVAPGGGKSWGENAVYRRWDNDNFAYVGRKLAEIDNAKVLIFGTAEEKGICDKIATELGEKATSLCGHTDLALLIEFIARCKLLICNEGGLLHIAVSRDVNTVSIFGPVATKVYGPYPPSKKHKAIVAGNIKCRPCYKDFKHKKCETRECLKKIDREKVLLAAMESLGVVESLGA